MANAFELLRQKRERERLQQEQALENRKKEEFFSRATQLPDEQQNFSSLSSLAQQVGVSSEVVRDWLNVFDNELKRRKSLTDLTAPKTAPSKDKLPTGETQLTPFIFNLLKKKLSSEQLQPLQTPQPLQLPFGKIEGRPATLPDIQSIIGQQLPIRKRLGGGMPSPLQPELGVFGQPALQSLPQAPDVTQTVPTNLIKQLTNQIVDTTGSKERFGELTETISRSLNEKPYIQQDIATKRKINKEVFTAKVALAKEKKLVEVEAEQNKLLTTNEMSHTYNPVTLQQFKGELSLKQARNKNAVWVDAEQKKSMREMSRVKLAVFNIDSLSKKVITAKNSFFEQNKQLIVKGIGAFIAADNQAKLFLGERQGLAALFSRYFGENGRLTDADIKRAQSLLPDLQDSDSLRAYKIAQLNDFINMAHTMLIEEVRGNFDAISVFKQNAHELLVNALKNPMFQQQTPISAADFRKGLPQ